MSDTNPVLTSPINSDWVLRSLVKSVNESGLLVGITLTVGGMLVTGTLVGGREYFEDFADKVAASAEDDAGAAQVQAIFADLGAIYDRDPEPGEPLPSYIHLKDVRFFSPSGQCLPDHDGAWWRGRIDSVQGFMLGRVVP